MKYFNSFPKIVYDNLETRNIIAKVKLRDVLNKDYFAFHNYTVESLDKPWTIAHDYYGSVDRTWLVYLSNDIIDPYYEWHMDTFAFEAYLKKKYGSIETAQSQIDYYVDSNNIQYSKDTYTYSNSSIQATLTPKYAYDIEDEANENKRNIRLLRYDLAQRAEKSLIRLMK